jgi:glutamyl/glutaminyl-tRNA synthetase
MMSGYSLPPLPGGEGRQQLTLRIAPEPIGPLHLGNAYAAVVTEWYAHAFAAAAGTVGKLWLRFDDTNPDVEDARFVDLIQTELQWLGVRHDGVYFASDYLDFLYTCGLRLLDRNAAYICTCDREDIARMRRQSVACPCRAGPPDFARYKSACEGGAIPAKRFTLRLRCDMSHRNAHMRDPIAFRFCDKGARGSNHRWLPTFDFEGPLLDSLMGVDYTFKLADHRLRTEVHDYVQRLHGYVPTRHFFSGKIIFAGFVSGSLRDDAFRAELKSRKYNLDQDFWQDAGLGFVSSLRERGYPSEVLRELFLKTIPLNSHSKHIEKSIVTKRLRQHFHQVSSFIYLSQPEVVRIDSTCDCVMCFSAGASGTVAEMRRYSLEPGGIVLIDSTKRPTHMDRLAFCSGLRLDGGALVPAGVDGAGTCGRLLLGLPQEHTCVAQRTHHLADGWPRSEWGAVEDAILSHDGEVVSLYDKGLHRVKVTKEGVQLWAL